MSDIKTEERVNIAVSIKTHAKLTTLTRKDQTYNDTVTRIVDFYENMSAHIKRKKIVKT